MKKIIFLISTLVITLFIVPTNIKATTLNDLKSELTELESKAAANANKKNMTKEKMAQIRQEINDTEHKIYDGRIKIDESKKEIEKLNVQIEEKNEEIKELVRFEQVADGDNAYLDYLFGAKDFTDFIYRASVVEQLSKYNKENIQDMNNLIEENKQLQEKIKKEEKELKKLTVKLEANYDKLDNDLVKLEETALDVSDQVKAQKDIIKMYEDMGCKDNQDISSCSNVPLSSGFNDPLRGRAWITSYFGYRNSPCSGCSSYHRGIDLSGSGIGGAPIYASASGRVATIVYKASCGGTQVYINHTVKGKNYMTAYKHLRSVNVSVNSVVTPNTVIGTVGGDWSTPWDYCSTGAHLHFEIAYGHYSTWYLNNVVDPTGFINF